MKFLNVLVLSAICLCISFSSCKPVMIATISADKVPSKKSLFVFENDTVKITYKFWANRGKMVYDIYNKLDQPLYVDWKNSAYIPNDKMISYWRDEVNTESTYATTFVYSNVAAGKMKSKAIHQERIGVVPPHSLITSSQFNLLSTDMYLSTSGGTSEEITSADGKRKTTAKVKHFDKENSPLQFRNYLAVCTNEKFEGKVCFIDNSFYVSSVNAVKQSKALDYKSNGAFYTYKEKLEIKE